MNQEIALIRQGLKTPRAAAIAGLIFSVLLITSQLLIRSSIPANPLAPVGDVLSHSKVISRALNLMPFAGIAFLWFVGVVRDRIEKTKTVFLPLFSLGAACCI